jgi:hypothetical protein
MRACLNSRPSSSMPSSWPKLVTENVPGAVVTIRDMPFAVVIHMLSFLSRHTDCTLSVDRPLVRSITAIMRPVESVAIRPLRVPSHIVPSLPYSEQFVMPGAMVSASCCASLLQKVGDVRFRYAVVSILNSDSLRLSVNIAPFPEVVVQIPH